MTESESGEGLESIKWKWTGEINGEPILTRYSEIFCFLGRHGYFYRCKTVEEKAQLTRRVNKLLLMESLTPEEYQSMSIQKLIKGGVLTIKCDCHPHYAELREGNAEEDLCNYRSIGCRWSYCNKEKLKFNQLSIVLINHYNRLSADQLKK